MNIKQAKECIKQTVVLYLKKDEYDGYAIPVVRQRPVFLLGAPGIGKTAIMEQIAEELNLALVSYAMTHHTRQSALGLPVIRHRVYEGVEADITEYTMSEIIVSIYDTIENSGMKEGILFLDEINCVSETLAPSMLQFLQYKEFGNHKIPEGWVVVTAGNPPEFNKSVREFDVVVMDRLKVIEVTPDYQVFREYAGEMGIHPSITGFLDIKKEYFYHIENTVKGRNYVTARGWEDLSTIITMYEEAGFEVDETLISQYIRDEAVVKEFAAFYELYLKYRRDYGVNEILKGEYSEASVDKASKAAFDERLCLLGMLMDKLLKDIKDSVLDMNCLTSLMPVIKAVGEKAKVGDSVEGIEDANKLSELLKDMADIKRNQLRKMSQSGVTAQNQDKEIRFAIKFLEEVRKQILNDNGNYDEVKRLFNERVLSGKERAQLVSNELHYAFEFIARAFEDGNEMLIFVTNLTTNEYAAGFLSRNPSEDYQRYHKELMIEHRALNLNDRIREVIE